MQAESSAAESESCSDVPASLTGRMCSASAHVNPVYEDVSYICCVGTFVSQHHSSFITLTGAI